MAALGEPVRLERGECGRIWSAEDGGGVEERRRSRRREGVSEAPTFGAQLSLRSRTSQRLGPWEDTGAP